MKDETAKEMVEELWSAIAELESDGGLVRFVKGHGLQSRYFAFGWESPRLMIDFRLPYARVLSDDERQAEDSDSIGAALRLAILLITADDEDWLLSDGEAALSVSAGEFGRRYAITGADGEVVDSSDDWDPLIARLDAEFQNDTGDLQIILP